MQKEPITITHPIVAGQWHPTKNGDLRPEDVTAGSQKRPWFFCHTCGYEWDALVLNRAREKDPEKCPACLNKVAWRDNTLAVRYPDIAAQMLPEFNDGLGPEDVCPGWTKVVNWHSKECGHTWPAEIRVRCRVEGGTACNICLNRVIIPEENSLAVLDPPLASEWHPTLNGNLKPTMVAVNYTKPVMWECKVNPLHVWPQSPNSRHSNGLGCPGCSGQMVFAGDKDLATTDPEIAAEWHPTLNTKKPTEVSRGSDYDAWWIRKECGHTYHDTVAHRIAGRGCGVCSSHQIQVGVTDLGTTHPEKSKFWHPTKNGKLKPTDVHAGERRKIWLLCPECGEEWPQKIFLFVQGKGCSNCREKAYSSKAEKEIAQFCEELGFEIRRCDRRVLGGSQEIDIYIPELKLGIEYNGIYWHSEEGGKDEHYHQDKYLRAQQAGIKLIQIWEDDWTYRNDVVRTRLLEHLRPETVEQKNIEGELVELPAQAALEFLQQYALANFSKQTTLYYGLQVDLEIVAVMACTRRVSEMHIDQYGTRSGYGGTFRRMIKLLKESEHTDKILFESDNSWEFSEILLSSGFDRAGVASPQQVYAKRDRRVIAKPKVENKVWTAGGEIWQWS